nr:cyclic peptide export ABC transporter [uncultured Chitinophaga sp.]
MKVIVMLTGLLCSVACSQQKAAGPLLDQAEREVKTLMKAGGIPGLSMVIIDSGRQIIKTYGYADIQHGTKVGENTLFQLGSCSKAFTALAAMKLIASGQINPDTAITAYIPWFQARYKEKPVPITVRQLVHHTSGIPWQTITAIPVSHRADALTQTVEAIAGISLKRRPGSAYEYATVNYDILALIIQRVTGQSFETYLENNVFRPLQLSSTTIGVPADSNLMATGYKLSFFRPVRYNAPVFRGNNAAGYVISNAVDMAAWLQFQMGTGDTALYRLAAATHQRDETVPLHDMSAYAMGWEVSLRGNNEIYHSGANPNFTAYVAFRPGSKRAVAVMTNSNSGYTVVIGEAVMKILSGEKVKKTFDPGDGNDRVYAIVSFIFAFYILIASVLFLKMLTDIFRKRRLFEKPSVAEMKKVLMSLVAILPFLYGLYIFPLAMAGSTWNIFFVWNAGSLPWMVTLLIAAVVLSYIIFYTGLCFPERNGFKKIFPQMLLMSILSGVANILVIILITSALDANIRLRYQVFYYLLALALYLCGRRFVQINLIRFSRNLIYELRIKLINRIFATSYQKFEQVDAGRVYTTINDDIETIGGTADHFIIVMTSFFTITGAFLYMASIAFWTTILAVLLILAISLVYYFVSKNTNRYFEEARDTRNVFVQYIHGMVDGFKELSMHQRKKNEYQQDIVVTAGKYRNRIITANIRFANAFMIGESMLILLLGLVVFAMPRLFPDVQHGTIMNFVIVILYLIGPIDSMLSSVPAIMQLKVAWRRIQHFIAEIPANLGAERGQYAVPQAVDSIRLDRIQFRYKGSGQEGHFEVGPVDLEIRRGEICFVIGGNGSGKTTLAKLLTGLYEPDAGRILINNKEVSSSELSEHFSTVFSPAVLFKKLYAIDAAQKGDQVAEYLKLLGLTQKVTILDNSYSTISLSSGQRKRLALLQCYLEDAPVYLFDEWASDQDPEYRSFFYRTLLPAMKAAGKIVIAITHDEHYFNAADKILKLEQGKVLDGMGDYFLQPVVSAGS